ncbi:hypothetical protein [Nonomuraea diastatica]|nr:hypothetical protein [Nonomuraea diastatica]
MLGRDLFEDALHGVREPDDKEIADRAQVTADQFVKLLDNGVG